MRFLLLFVTLTYSAFADSAIIDGIKVGVSKKGDSKLFSANGSASLFSSEKLVRAAILDFNNRCNQSLAKRRKIVSKDFKCRYHNPSLVESVEIRKLKNRKYKNDKSILDEFLVWRSVYNRNAYSYYDLILVKRVSAEQLEISYKMLSDDEVSFYIDSFKPKNTAFDESGGVFKLFKKANAVDLELHYLSETNHWLLTSALAESTILEKVATGTKLALEAIKGASERN